MEYQKLTSAADAAKAASASGSAFSSPEIRYNHYLSIGMIIIGEERANSTINQTADQNFVIGKFAFAFHKSTRYFSGRSKFFLVVDGKR